MLYMSQIAKVDVQHFESDGRSSPACTIELKWTGRGKPKCLSHKVNIIGAKKPNNYFYMRYSPQECESLCLYYALCICILAPACLILLATATAIAKPLSGTRATFVPKSPFGRYMYTCGNAWVNVCVASVSWGSSCLCESAQCAYVNACVLGFIQIPHPH